MDLNSRDPLKKREFRAGHLTVRRLRYRPAVEKMLQRMDARQLFLTSVKGKKLAAENVRRFVKMRIDDVLDAEMRGPVLRDVPIPHRNHSGGPVFIAPSNSAFNTLDRPALFRLLGYFPIADRIRFGQTCRLHFYLISLFLQSNISNLLAKFGLRYGDVKILQAATGAVISGSFVPALLHKPFIPNDIDFYCNYLMGGKTVKYLLGVGPLSFQDYTHRQYTDLGGVKGVWTLRGPDNISINVIETYAKNPLRCILSDFHSSPPRGVIDWDGLDHFEADQVSRGVAMISPRMLRLGDPEELDDYLRIWNILHKYRNRGFEFAFDYGEPHECGEHTRCPATLRTTKDAGTLHIPLPGMSIPVHIGHVRNEIAWSLCGPLCPSGTLKGRKTPQNATGFQDRVFRSVVSQLLKFEDAPPQYAHQISMYSAATYAEVLDAVEYEDEQQIDPFFDQFKRDPDVDMS